MPPRVNLLQPIAEVIPEKPIGTDDAFRQPSLPVGPKYLHHLFRRLIGRLEPQERLDLKAWASNQAEWSMCTACSGTDAPVLVWQTLAEVLKADMGVKFAVHHLFSAEKHKGKQKFIAEMFPDLPVLVGNTSELRYPMVRNVLTGRPCKVPSAELIMAGFPCTDASTMNKDTGKLENKSCVLNSSLNTGSVFKDLLDYMDRHSERTVLGIFENVLALAWPPKQPKGSDVAIPSNLSVAVAMLSEMQDCVTKCWHLDPRMFGVPQSRPRVWVVSFKRRVLRSLEARRYYTHNIKQ